MDWLSEYTEKLTKVISDSLDDEIFEDRIFEETERKMNIFKRTWNWFWNKKEKKEEYLTMDMWKEFLDETKIVTVNKYFVYRIDVLDLFKRVGKLEEYLNIELKTDPEKTRYLKRKKNAKTSH